MSQKEPERALRTVSSSDDIYWTTERLMNLEVLLEIGNIGAEQATTALSEVLHEQILVRVPRLHTSPPHLVPKIYGKRDVPVVVIFMQLKTTADCDVMLTFEMDEARKIASIMSNFASDEKDKELEKSALEELGSIMICSFLGAMADFAGTCLVPTPPQLIEDSFDAVIDGLLAKQALSSDIAVVFDARFKRCNSSGEGNLIMFPSPELQKMLLARGKTFTSTSTSVET